MKFSKKKQFLCVLLFSILFIFILVVLTYVLFNYNLNKLIRKGVNHKEFLINYKKQMSLFLNKTYLKIQNLKKNVLEKINEIKIKFLEKRFYAYIDFLCGRVEKSKIVYFPPKRLLYCNALPQSLG